MLEDQKRYGVARRLALFEAVVTPLLLYDEPTWEGDKVVGLITSGTVGTRTGKDFALGLIDIGRAEKLSETATTQCGSSGRFWSPFNGCFRSNKFFGAEKEGGYIFN